MALTVFGGFVTLAAFIAQSDATCVSTGAGCISGGDDSCVGRADGVYQSCSECTSYHECFDGKIWKNRQCPLTNTDGLRGQLVWQQVSSPNDGFCSYTSTSCRECVQSRRSDLLGLLGIKGRASDCNTGSASGTRCLRNTPGACVGLHYGDYQSCESCTVYHSCYEGVLYANRPCPGGLFWQSSSFGIGVCEWESTTCRACP